MARRLDWLISVDDHVLEPPHVWTDRIPRRYLEAAPRVVRDAEGEAWVFEGKRMPTQGLQAVAGKRHEDFSPDPITYAEMRPGCYDPVARLEDMDRDGVLASMCFPSFPRFCGQTFLEATDLDLALLCVRAWNDWMAEEWCGSAPGRFIPSMIIPLWDPTLAAREIERCAAMGTRTVIFSENPYVLGLPSIHDSNRFWNPVLSAASEARMPLSIHIGSSSRLPTTSPDNPMMIPVVLTSLASATTAVDWLFSGHFSRFPELRICLSEGGIGWIPYVLERAEHVVERQRFWAGTTRLDFGAGAVEHMPEAENRFIDLRARALFRDHIFGCFIDDPHGVANLDLIGVDNVMIETDYPHSDSSWPNSIEKAHKRLSDRTPDEIWKIFQGNARRIYDFEPARPAETGGD